MRFWRLRRLWHRFREWFTGRVFCGGCGYDIDPDCCHCGDDLATHHSGWEGHSFVPMGCVCGYVTKERS